MKGLGHCTFVIWRLISIVFMCLHILWHTFPSTSRTKGPLEKIQSFL